MIKNDDFAESLLDDGHSLPKNSQDEDFADLLLDDGNLKFIQKPTPKRNPSNLRNKPRTPTNTSNYSPQPPFTPPKPTPPLVNTKNNYSLILKRLFWVGIISFSLFKYCNKQLDSSKSNKELSTVDALDTFNLIKFGKSILPAKALYRDGKYLPENEFADSIIVLGVISSDIHQYNLSKGKIYKSYEGYSYAGNDQWEGRGDYSTKYSKRMRYFDMDFESYNNLKGSCSFTIVTEKPMGTEIEVRGCDIEYDRDDDLTEILYIYNSPDDPKISTRRRGFIYSKFLDVYDVKLNKVKKEMKSETNIDYGNVGEIKSKNVVDPNKWASESEEEFRGINKNLKDEKIPNNESVSDDDKINDFYLGQLYSGGYVFSLDNELAWGKIFATNLESCKFRKISKLLKGKNKNDAPPICCKWRLPTTTELTMLFKSGVTTLSGTYWTSELISSLGSINEDSSSSDVRDRWWESPVQSILIVNMSNGKVLESTETEAHHVLLMRDFSFNEK